ncbi:MAG: AtpZ/AtpI family protein [Bacteroidota bacterium]
MEQDPSAPKKQKPYNDFLKYSGLGLQLLAGIGLSAWVGHLIDGYFGFSFPVFLLSFVMLSFGGMMYQLYRSINK